MKKLFTSALMVIVMVTIGLLSCVDLAAQSLARDDVPVLKEYYHIDSVNSAQKSSTLHPWTQYLNPFQLMLLMYKGLLSEQLSSHCAFEPSCSTFSSQAFHEFGVFKGLFLTVDRLNRCNGYAEENLQLYLLNENNAKIRDTPAMYRFRR